MGRGASLIVLAGLLACLASANAQEPAPVFKSESDLVVLHVNVLDGRSDAVPGLPQGAFRIFEDGLPQEITFFSGADVPVAVGLVMDNSGSMIARNQMVVAGGMAFARASHPEDETFTIHFNEQIQFGLPQTVPFTTSQSLLQAALARHRPGGKTALHDAVIAGLEHLRLASLEKRVLVVLSDGEDNASRYSEDDMIGRARAGDAIIYTVSTANPRQGTDGNNGVLRKLADVTGGVSYFPESDARVVEAFDEIAANIRRGYTIGYVPANPAHDGRYRRVNVTVQAPGRTNLKVRSRDGYRPHDHTDAR